MNATTTASVVLATLVVGFASGAAMTHAARAENGASPSTTCGTTTPCLVEDNTSSGNGVESESKRGNGLLATTMAIGANSTNGGSALLGKDLQVNSGDGLFNFGVSGISTNGTGVQGTGGSAGISGVNTSATGVGVLAATTNSNGLLFEGSGKEIGNFQPVFTMNANGQATFGNTTSGYSTGNVTVYNDIGCGGMTPMYAAMTESGLTFEVDGCGQINNENVAVESPYAIVTDYLNSSDGFVDVDTNLNSEDQFTSYSDSATNTYAVDTDAVTWLYQGYSDTAGKYTVEMGDSGSIYARIFITTSEPRVSQVTTDGQHVDTYAPQVTQPSLEDFGEAQLSDGSARVSLDPKFASAIDITSRYLVSLTPEGDCRGLYVAERDASGFTVRELQGGRSSIGFSYRIDARPLGNDDPRMPASTLPYGFAHRVPPPSVRHPQRSAPQLK
jgi:hypothetical protein